MGTKRNPGKYDCHARADIDEPLFTLLARDKRAPVLVWLWSILEDLDDNSDPAKAEEARDCVKAMIEFQIERNRPTGRLDGAAMTGRLALWELEKRMTEVNSEFRNRLCRLLD